MTGFRAFEAASRLNFTRAALEMSLTPAAVSHQIKNLEEPLGTRLFVHNNNAQALTATAEIYLCGVHHASWSSPSRPTV